MDGIVSDSHGTIIHANQSAARIFDRPLEKLIGNGYISLIHPRERQAAHASLLKMIASEITHGHRVGDAVLCTIARRLTEHIRSSDTVARLGGDEFVVLAPEIENIAEAGVLAEKVVRLLAAPLAIDGMEFGVTVSIGIATYPADGESTEELIAAADRAMYAAKNDGRNTWRMASQVNDRDAT